jgi:mannose-1-phosphate guanylyltransferase
VDTVERARALASDDRIRILAGPHLVEPFRSVLPDLPESCYWVEPRARGTAPVLAWAAQRIAREDPDAVMVSLHADHVLRPIEALQRTVEVAAQVARDGHRLVCLGIAPDRIETGYGHVEPGEVIDDVGPPTAYVVRAFHEKPDAETAQRYVDAGYLWNTGIFVWRAADLVEEIGRHSPALARHLEETAGDDDAFFDGAPVSVIDREVMERSDRVATVRASFEWDDVGSWPALMRSRGTGSDGNTIVGDAASVDASGNIVYAEGGRVVLFGVRDLVVVQSGGLTMVLPRDQAGDLKDFVGRLEGGVE